MQKSIRLTLYLYLLLVIINCKENTTFPDPFDAGWNGERVCEILEDNPKIRILKCTFPPNIGHEQHYHEPHFGYTLVGGKFKITDAKGTREVNVPNGYSFKKDSITSHEVLNIGKTTAQFLIIEYK
ncbi:MAG: cupin domain-containing protein [Flavobacteriaceae bacterium]|nr:cupin domain-containing protein [Flavobacteriaceae bacterium]